MEQELATNPVAEAPTLGTEAPEVAQPEVEIAEEVPQVEDDSEEVEHDGQKYRVPKAVKPLLMMQADYTRKTQEVAEQRKALDAERTSHAEQARAQQEHIKDLAKLYGMDEQLEQYSKVDWRVFWEQDPVKAGAASSQFQALQHARAQLAQNLTRQQQEKAFQAQQETAKRMEEAFATVKRDIPDWSPELASKLRDFAVSKAGLKPAEIDGLSDPRHVKLLHLAYVGSQLIEKQRQAAKPAQPEAKPVPQVTARAAPNTGLRDDISTEEWVKRRNAQLAKR